jgi:tetratricopeptide (TPR) repeat protein
MSADTATTRRNGAARGAAALAPALRGARPAATTLLVGAAVLGLALDGGTYRAPARDALAVAVWWTVALTLALRLWPRAAVGRRALVTGGLLALFAAWTGLSALWAPAPETAIAELDRATLYLGMFALAVLATRPGDGERWCDGIGLGIAAVATLALASRLFPHLAGTQESLAQALPGAESRLSYPLGYWNGLGMLVAFGVAPLLRAATAPRPVGRRALALAPLPVLACVVYLTSSRGAVAVAAAGTAVFVGLAPRRGQAVLALVVGAAGGAIAIALLHARPELVDGPLASDAAFAQGRSAAVLLLLVCGAVAAAWALAGRIAPRQVSFPRGARALAWALAIAVLTAGVAAANPSRRFEDFKVPPATSERALDRSPSYVESHLLSGAGSGRWQFWGGALDEFGAHPVGGRGAGTFEAWWAQHGSIRYFVRDAHSLWLETLGELGIVGLALLAAAFASGLAAAWDRRGGVERSTSAALSAVLVAFALAASLDWMWELAAVTGVAVICLALLVGPATRRETGKSSPRGSPRRAAVAALVSLNAALVVSHALPLLGDSELRRSRAAAAKGDTPAAIEAALRADRLEPWAARAPLQLALVQERAGDLPAARRWLGRALGRNDSDWRTWLIAARIETRQGDVAAARESLAHARRLNPRSPVLGGHG